jgi:hypothetical protein
MLGVTIFGIFFTPVFYLVIRWMTARKKDASQELAAKIAAQAAVGTEPEPVASHA